MSHCIQKGKSRGNELGKRAKWGNSKLTESGNCCKCQQHFLYMRVYRQPYLLMAKKGGENRSRSVASNGKFYTNFHTKVRVRRRRKGKKEEL